MEAPANNKDEDSFSDEIGRKEKRKLKASLVSTGSVWSGLGMFGMVGWSVAVPTFLGAVLGFWLDKNYHQSFSWTLTLLIIGLIIGSLIAGYWVSKEDKDMHQDKEEKDE
jgi:ATP synthase protein I